MNQNLQENAQIQNYQNNNFNNNFNNYQNNINQQYNNNNIDINQILNNLQNNNDSNQFQIQNNNQFNMINNNNSIHQNKNYNHNHISNSLNLYKLDKETIIKEAYNLTKGQMGCRFLQKKVEDETEFALEFIYPIILKHLNEIIVHKFGNYLIQKFLDYLPQKEIFNFIINIEDNFLFIGLNQYGTRVIQKLLEHIKSEGDQDTVNNYKKIVSLIIPNIIKFSNDLNACHIIQQIFITKNFSNKFLYEFYRNNIVKITNDKNGCCFLQKFIDKLNGEELNEILESIFLNIKEIIIDKYGNYVIQYIIKNIITMDGENHQNIKKFNLHEIFKFILDDFVKYSNQKYSSNVIEKLFSIDELKPELYQKLKTPDITKNLLLEKYGNYVIQKGLNLAEDKDKDELLKIIGNLSEELKTIEFGNKLLNKLMTKYPKLINYMNDKKENDMMHNDNINNNFNNNAINKIYNNNCNNNVNKVLDDEKNDIEDICNAKINDNSKVSK